MLLTMPTSLLLGNDDDMDDEDMKMGFDRSLMPELVVTLDAPAEFLRNRIMNLPETVVAGTHNTEVSAA